MSYDPDDDFDNNPFAQPFHDNSGIGAAGLQPQKQSVVAPVDSLTSEQGAKDSHTTGSSSGVNYFHETLADTPPSPPPKPGNSIGSQDFENQDTLAQYPQDNNNEPSLQYLPERRSKKNYFIRITVKGIERVAKKDPVIKFDAKTNMPHFRGSVFKDVRRTYYELAKFHEYLNNANPECFVASLPPATTSYGAGLEEDEVSMNKHFQDWFDKLTNDPILIRNEEVMFFIQNDFGYSPNSKLNFPASGLKRKTLKQFQPPHDEIEELVKFRPLIKQIYLDTNNISKVFDKLVKLQKLYGMLLSELGHKIDNMAETLEGSTSHPGMINLWHRFGPCLVTFGDIETVSSVYQSAIFGDEIKMISEDSYLIKEQLTNRHLLMRDLISAEQNTRNKHAQALKVKTKKYEDPMKIDQIINELEDAKKFEDGLKIKINRVSNNLLIEKREVMKAQQVKIKQILQTYTKKMIDTERKVLSTLEKIRVDVRQADDVRHSRSNSHSIDLARSSQRYDGDSWSGDKKQNLLKTNSKENEDENVKTDADDHDALGTQELVNAQSAASVLATMAF